MDNRRLADSPPYRFGNCARMVAKEPQEAHLTVTSRGNDGHECGRPMESLFFMRREPRYFLRLASPNHNDHKGARLRLRTLARLCFLKVGRW